MQTLQIEEQAHCAAQGEGGIGCTEARLSNNFSMRLKRRIIIAFAVIASLLVVVLAVPFFSLFYPMMRQMRAGHNYMDSLTEVEIQ